MKENLIVTLLAVPLIFKTKIYSQNVAVNTPGKMPEASALVDANNITKGLLSPRITTTQQNAIVLPDTGLLIFSTTTNNTSNYTSCK